MNKYNPHIYHRKSIRLKGYDYSQAGLYFITICCQNRACLFGEIVDEKTVLNNAGKMIENAWVKLPERFKNIKLHEYVIMPNHLHGILEIVGATLVVAQNATSQNAPNIVAQNGNNQKGQPQGIAPTGKMIGDMIGGFKSITTVEYIRGVKNDDWQSFDGKLWQRNYWEHIIRNENEHQRIAQYIMDNPKKWALDKLNDGMGNQVLETTAEYNNEAWMI